MVPSLFAILVMFLFMRLFGIPLNVATILIATTVLGATENDQIHFFYHFQEAAQRRLRPSGRSRHAIRVAGHAIVFATLINAGGFLALILSSLPPMRQFGIITALAFALRCWPTSRRCRRRSGSSSASGRAHRRQRHSCRAIIPLRADPLSGTID